MKPRFYPNKVTRTRQVEAKKAANKPRPLIFDFSPDEFRGLKGMLSFKFVFLLEENRLVIGPEGTDHKEIARHAFGSDAAKNKSAVIGAFFDSMDNKGKMVFKVLGRSGFYGLPSQENLRKAADHITGHLKSFEITEQDNLFLIEEK
jgi:hypothetical protein